MIVYKFGGQTIATPERLARCLDIIEAAIPRSPIVVVSAHGNTTDLLADAARGAQAFAVITNDGWFGPTSGPYQLQRDTVLRAIENRRDVARCANNGISCFISAYGDVWDETELYTRTAIVSTIRTSTESTFYTRHGDWLPIGTTVASGLLLLLSVIVIHYRK